MDPSQAPQRSGPSSAEDYLVASISEAMQEDGAVNALFQSTNGPCLDLLRPDEFQSLPLNAAGEERISFLLLDEEEKLQVANETILAEKLGCDLDHTQAKVVSIIGNTGEGKSHTLNHCLFEGKDVFSTSSDQSSSTFGVWAAFQQLLGVIVLDTEGMLGLSNKENQKKRQLLKILAFSDVVVYKTRAERLGNDLFNFLDDASKAFNLRFSEELKKITAYGCDRLLGPTVIICHETTYTDVIPAVDDDGKTADTVIKERLEELQLDSSAFERIIYLGHKGNHGSKSHKGRTDDVAFWNDRIHETIKRAVGNNDSRRPRSLKLMYETLVCLTSTFNDSLTNGHRKSFPDEYFTCIVSCQVCNSRCDRSVNHKGRHKSGVNCVFDRQRDNRRFFCRKCKCDGRNVEMVLKSSSAKDNPLRATLSYLSAGYVLECDFHGILYTTHRNVIVQNVSPAFAPSIHSEIDHLWPGEKTLQGTQNAGQHIANGVNDLTSTFAELTAEPIKLLKDAVKDKVRPTNWVPDAAVSHCSACLAEFGRRSENAQNKHHCRSCGKIFCAACSDFKRPVRNWPDVQRTCKKCYDDYQRTRCDAGAVTSDPSDIQARQYTESATNFMSSAIQGAKGIVKDTVRPAYWQHDDEALVCPLCDRKFSREVTKHHCRVCGKVVCDLCSKSRQPVPQRGWNSAVRVCDVCVRSEQEQ